MYIYIYIYIDLLSVAVLIRCKWDRAFAMLAGSLDNLCSQDSVVVSSP